MEKRPKTKIYKGIIQYLLESTPYSLKNIADLSNSSIRSIHSIYFNDYIPPEFTAELQLIKIYQLILELEMSKRIIAEYINN